MKVLIGIVFGFILFLCSMVDGRMLYNPEEIIDCQVGKYIFPVTKLECTYTLEHKLVSLFN